MTAQQTIDKHFPTKEEFNKFVGIGFCQQKFYTTAAWNKAKKAMSILVEYGYAEAYDFGRGKGKYRTTEAHLHTSISDMADMCYQDVKNQTYLLENKDKPEFKGIDLDIRKLTNPKISM